MHFNSFSLPSSSSALVRPCSSGSTSTSQSCCDQTRSLRAHSCVNKVLTDCLLAASCCCLLAARSFEAAAEEGTSISSCGCNSRGGTAMGGLQKRCGFFFM